MLDVSILHHFISTFYSFFITFYCLSAYIIGTKVLNKLNLKRKNNLDGRKSIERSYGRTLTCVRRTNVIALFKMFGAITILRVKCFSSYWSRIFAFVAFIYLFYTIYTIYSINLVLAAILLVGTFDTSKK